MKQVTIKHLELTNISISDHHMKVNLEMSDLDGY